MVAAIMLLMAAAIAGYAIFLYLQRSQKLELIGDEVRRRRGLVTLGFIMLVDVQQRAADLPPLCASDCALRNSRTISPTFQGTAHSCRTQVANDRTAAAARPNGNPLQPTSAAASLPKLSLGCNLPCHRRRRWT